MAELIRQEFEDWCIANGYDITSCECELCAANGLRLCTESFHATWMALQEWEAQRRAKSSISYGIGGGCELASGEFKNVVNSVAVYLMEKE